MKQIKAAFRGANSIKHKFSESQCLITISVGQESHEGERFAATMELINRSFKGYVITLHDTLQRYTIALDKKEEPEYFRQMSIHEGNLWLKRNEKYYKKPNLIKIIRWEEWLNHSAYSVCEAKIKNNLIDDLAYKTIFDTTVDNYLARYCKRLTNKTYFDENRAYQLCFDYLIEECVVLCLWPETKCKFELYPGRHNAAVEATRHKFILPYYSDFLHPVTVGFNYRRDMQPQSFELLKTE